SARGRYDRPPDGGDDLASLPPHAGGRARTADWSRLDRGRRQDADCGSRDGSGRHAGIHRYWLDEESADQRLQFVDLPFGGSSALRHGLGGAVKIEQSDTSNLWRDSDVGRVSRKSGAGNAILSDVDRVHHHRGDARRAVAAAKDLPMQQMDRGTAVAAWELGVLRG